MSQLRTIASTIVLCLIGISGCGGDGNTSANSVAATPGISVFAGKVGGYGNLNGSVKTARFDYATDVAVDSAGNLFVAEFSAVRKISSDGVVTTFVGKSDESGSIDGTGSSARFLGPLSLAIDGTDTLYVAESGNGTLRKITPSGTVTTFVKKANGLENPIAIALDQSGFVYVSDRNAILKISPAGVINSLAGANDGTVGSADGVGNAARFQFPQGIAVDNAGTVFVADSGNGTIRKITSDGVVTTLAGLAGAANDVVDGLGSAARFTATNGIEVDRNGTIFVTDLFAKTVRKITSAGLVSTFAGVTSRWTNGASIDGIGLDAGFIFPTGMTIDGRGNLFVIDATSTVRKVTQTTKVTTIAGSAPNPGYADGPGPAAMFNSPRNLAIDLSGNLYVADYFNNLIRKISPAGIVSTLAGNPSAIQGGSVDGLAAVSMFNAPQGVAVDQSGYVYVADTGNNSIRRISPAGIVATLAILTTTDSSTYTQYMNGPVGIAVNKTGDIFTANSVTGRFHRIRLFANGVVDDQSYLPY
ncbi:MAG: NHL repeat-containing protein, partial [Pseudomonadota bacterium]